jgi:hypothetical protein
MDRSAAGYDAAMSRGQKLALRAGVLLTTILLAAGCTGRPASTSSWQGAADRALGAAISGLGTARVALEVESGDRGPHTFTVVTVTDAIETSSKEASSFQVSQPPDALHAANEAVNQGLDDAVSLLVEVRVALASPGVDSAAAQRLVDRVDALRKKLDDLHRTVQRSPGSLGRS